MTDTQRKLLDKATRNIRVSRVLVQEGATEVAVTRAYYAMFYAAEALLLEKGQSFSKHSAVISAFGHYYVAQGLVPAAFHQYIRDAQQERNVSDYLIEDEPPAEIAEMHIAHAEEFIALAENILRKASESGSR